MLAEIAALAVNSSFDVLGQRVILRPTSGPDIPDVPIIPDSGMQSLNAGTLELGTTGLRAQIRTTDTGGIKPRAWLIIFADGRTFKITNARFAEGDSARLKWAITAEEVRAS